jgi:hypothetical protein
MRIKTVLLVGAALCAISMAPVVAAPAPHIIAVAAHPGNAHVKTALHTGKIHQITSTIAISTGVSTSADYKKKTPLVSTFYTFFDSGNFCKRSEKEKMKLPVKKTAYAKLSTGVETRTGYCSTAPTKFYGDNYDLQTRKAKGKTDKFISTLVGRKIHYNGGLYNIDLNLDVTVAIGP